MLWKPDFPLVKCCGNFGSGCIWQALFPFTPLKSYQKKNGTSALLPRSSVCSFFPLRIFQWYEWEEHTYTFVDLWDICRKKFSIFSFVFFLVLWVLMVRVYRWLLVTKNPLTFPTKMSVVCCSSIQTPTAKLTTFLIWWKKLMMPRYVTSKGKGSLYLLRKIIVDPQRVLNSFISDIPLKIRSLFAGLLHYQ